MHGEAKSLGRLGRLPTLRQHVIHGRRMRNTQALAGNGKYPHWWKAVLFSLVSSTCVCADMAIPHCVGPYEVGKTGHPGIRVFKGNLPLQAPSAFGLVKDCAKSLNDNITSRRVSPGRISFPRPPGKEAAWRSLGDLLAMHSGNGSGTLRRKASASERATAGRPME